MSNSIKKIEEDRKEMLEFFCSAIPIAAALFVFLASAAYIIYKCISNKQYNDRWKDYDECGLS